MGWHPNSSLDRESSMPSYAPKKRRLFSRIALGDMTADHRDASEWPVEISDAVELPVASSADARVNSRTALARAAG